MDELVWMDGCEDTPMDGVWPRKCPGCWVLHNGGFFTAGSQEEITNKNA